MAANFGYRVHDLPHDPVPVGTDALELSKASSTGSIWSTLAEIFLRGFSGPGKFSVKDPAYGAQGGGVVDDTAAIQAALDAAGVAAGGRVVFPKDTYLVYGLKVPANVTVELGRATLLKRPATVSDQNVSTFTGNGTVFSPVGYAPFFYLIGNNVTIRGGTLDGNRANDTLGTGATWGGSFQGVATRAGILGSTNAIASVTDATVDGVRFQNMVGCAIDLDMTGVKRVTNCTEVNAGNMFANITGDATTFLTKGTLYFTGNSMAGDRVFNNVPNPTVLDRQEQTVCTGNVFDERLTATVGGCKFQDSYDTTITGNAFINTKVKPQSATTFYGDSFVCSGNVFVTYAPSTHDCGVSFGFHRVKSLVVDDNSITNGFIGVERSSDGVSVANNTIRITTDCRIGGTGVFYAIQGGANENGNVSGAELVSGNLIDLGGQAFHCFYQASSDIGDATIQANDVAGADHLFTVMTGSDTSSARLRVLGNTFRSFRAIGRMDLHGIGELVWKGNVLSKIDTATPSSIDSVTARALTITTAAATTYGFVTFDGNIINARETDWNFASLNFGTNGITTFALTNNLLNVYDSVSTGLSFGLTAAGTIATVIAKNNVSVGDVSLQGTHTAECVSGNSFTTTSPQRGFLGLTIKPVASQRLYAVSLTPASVAAQTTTEQTFAVTGLTTSDIVFVCCQTAAGGVGVTGARVTATNTLGIRFTNPSSGALTPPAGTYQVLATTS